MQIENIRVVIYQVLLSLAHGPDIAYSTYCF